MTGIIIPDEGKKITDPILEAHAQRVHHCRALFSECLRRYTADRQENKNNFSDQKIITVSLKTLVANGFTKAEVMDAMS